MEKMSDFLKGLFPDAQPVAVLAAAQADDPPVGGLVFGLAADGSTIIYHGPMRGRWRQTADGWQKVGERPITSFPPQKKVRR